MNRTSTSWQIGRFGRSESLGRFGGSAGSDCIASFGLTGAWVSPKTTRRQGRYPPSCRPRAAPSWVARLFFNEFPNVHGNGRTCNTCHVAEDGFQLSPAHAEARWQALQKRRRHHPGADDPLFRSIDADDFGDDFTTLRQHGLVRVTIQMAPNVRVLDDPTARSVSLWRSTPTVFNVAVTAPYQLDGRVPTLPLQALGALHGQRPDHE